MNPIGYRTDNKGNYIKKHESVQNKVWKLKKKTENSSNNNKQFWWTKEIEKIKQNKRMY